MRIHAPIETGEENTKDIFYEDLIPTYDELPGNVIELVLDYLNAKCRRETNFIPLISGNKQ